MNTHASSFRAPPPRRRQEDGIAVILVLAFLVLLTGLVLAFFSRAITERQVANASLNQNKADVLARSATDIIIGDFKQEIVNGSSPSPTAYPLYVPTNNAYMLPQASGTPSPSPSNSPFPVPNLVRRSVKNDSLAVAAPSPPAIRAVTTSASDANSTTASANGRSISLERWNAHYLIPKSATGDDTSIPVMDFVAPDWVMVTTGGPKVLTPSDLSTQGKSVIGRYAYAIYDEGGLFDANVAGYPSVTDVKDFSRKSSSAFADLTKMTITPAGSMPSATSINNLVGWRNYATAQPASTTPLVYTFDAAAATRYTNYVLSNATGFLSINPLPSPTPAGGANRTDQAFTSRQSLIKFRRAANSSVNILQNLTTFSRGINQPSYAPLPASTTPDATHRPAVLPPNNGGNNATGLDDQINPSFLTVRVRATKTNGRNDGTDLKLGEPLVKKRFAINRLAWLTYKGPSYQRRQFNVGDVSPGASDPDYDMWALVNLHGVSPSLLKQGTDDAIRKYFGLNWRRGYTDSAGTTFDAWLYNYNNNDPSGQASAGPAQNDSKGPILQLGTIAGLGMNAHEPDFIELLKATIAVGSIGKATTESASFAQPITGNGSTIATTSSPAYAALPANYRYNMDTSVDYHIIQIAANIISQAKIDGYPAQLVFNDGTRDRTFTGVANLPYLNYVFMGGIAAMGKTPSPDTTPGSNADAPPQAIPPTPPTPNVPAGTALTATGLGALFQIPALWNPHDVNGTVPSLRPTNFRLVVDSTDPDHIDPAGQGNANYAQFYPLAMANASGADVDLSDWTHRDSSTPASGVTNLDKPTGQQPAPKALTWKSTALQFTDLGGVLFREPTILFRAGTTGNPMKLTNAASGASATAWSLAGDFGSNTIANSDKNPLGVPSQNGGPLDPAGSQFLGIYLGPFPLRFHLPQRNNSNNKYAVTTNQVNYNLSSGANGQGAYFTYRLQYQDPNSAGNWITYDTKYGGNAQSNLPTYHYNQGKTTAIFGPGEAYNDTSGSTGWSTVIDPRSSRFGFLFGKDHYNFNGHEATQPPAIEYYNPNNSNSRGWIDAANGVLQTQRPDRQAGYFVFGNYTDNGHGANKTPDLPTPSAAAGWIFPNDEFFQTGADQVAPGMLTQNNSAVRFAYGRFSGEAGMYTRGQQNPLIYADADGVVRRAMGAYVPTTNTPSNYDSSIPLPTASDLTIGLPMARAMPYVNPPTNPPSVYNTNPTPDKYISEGPTWRYNQAQSRPLILNRPFRTVAELGYVFRDTAWKNLDFFTPESGDAALLDVFSLQDTDNPNGLVAGKVNLNTKNISIITAIVANAYLDDPKITDTTVGTIAPAAATTIAKALVARTTGASEGPMQNVSELVGKWVGPVAPTTPLLDSHPLRTYPKNSSNQPIMFDGKSSYSGFSGVYISPLGGVTAATNPARDLNSAYATAFSTNLLLLQTMTNVQRFHEAPIRALGASTQTRVWNLLIDVVAQIGRYPSNAQSLDKFNVEGEQRYWVHLAIDRFTGEVLDKQIEVVKE